MIITKKYLQDHPEYIFVFGDNLQRRGHGGAATLRDLPNTWGFITKKEPNNKDDSFYTVKEYWSVFNQELAKLESDIKSKPHNVFLISKLGSGLANKYRIWENIIEPQLKNTLSKYYNVMFLWDE